MVRACLFSEFFGQVLFFFINQSVKGRLDYMYDYPRLIEKAMIERYNKSIERDEEHLERESMM